MKSGLTPESLKRFLNDLEVLSIPPKKKREIVIRAIQMIKRRAVSTASHQQSPDGQGWKPRKNGTAKMLRRIAKLANSRAESDSTARLFYKNQKTGQIATEHQQGLDHRFKKSDFTSKDKNGSGKDPATPRQAKKLRDLGYSVAIGSKKGKKKWKKLSVSEIRQQLTRERAGLIIRKMSNKGEGKGLTEWIIPTEKRPFLDEREQKNAQIVTDILRQYLTQHHL
ncbi:hypothetical protein ACWIUA_00465 [Ursidibacter sp. B-7004-1]